MYRSLVNHQRVLHPACFGFLAPCLLPRIASRDGRENWRLRLMYMKKKKKKVQDELSARRNASEIARRGVRSASPNAHLTNSNRPLHMFSPVSSAARRQRLPNLIIGQSDNVPSFLLRCSYVNPPGKSPRVLRAAKVQNCMERLRKRADIYPRGGFKRYIGGCGRV